MQFAVVHFFGDFNPPHARVGAKKRARDEEEREKKTESHRFGGKKVQGRKDKDAETSNNLFHFPLFAALKGQGEREKKFARVQGKKNNIP